MFEWFKRHFVEVEARLVLVFVLLGPVVLCVLIFRRPVASWSSEAAPQLLSTLVIGFYLFTTHPSCGKGRPDLPRVVLHTALYEVLPWQQSNICCRQVGQSVLLLRWQVVRYNLSGESVRLCFYFCSILLPYTGRSNCWATSHHPPTSGFKWAALVLVCPNCGVAH